jgi:REP element-mobilizing transposase RayT
MPGNWRQSNHIHILLELPPTVCLAEEAGKLKASSSKWLNEQEWYRDKFRWQSEYGMFSVSESGVPELRRYIRNQKEHHRDMTYREEFEKLLVQHDISYEEKYLPWESD